VKKGWEPRLKKGGIGEKKKGEEKQRTGEAALRKDNEKWRKKETYYPISGAR